MFIAMCPKSILYNVASSGIESVRCGKFRESLIKNNEVDTIEISDYLSSDPTKIPNPKLYSNPKPSQK
jgi:hypothetical protein